MKNILTQEDYILENDSVWITVKGFSVKIKKTDEGVVCDIFLKGREDEDCIAGTYAFDNESEENESEITTIDRIDTTELDASLERINQILGKR